MTEDNLWGDLTSFDTIATPASILKVQGAVLEKATNGLLRCDLLDLSPQPSSRFVYSFQMVAPLLNGYSWEILKFSHEITLYPVRIHREGQSTMICENKDSFSAALAKILSSPETRRIIESLLSQIKQL